MQMARVVAGPRSAVAARHGNVRQHQVQTRAPPRDMCQNLHTGLDLRQNAHIWCICQHLFEAFTHDAVAVTHQHFAQGMQCYYKLRSNICNLNKAPSPI